VELYARVRRAVIVEKMSEREAARQFGLARDGAEDAAVFGPARLSAATAGAAAEAGRAWNRTIDQILKDDKARGRKQRHTARQIFEQLRDEHSYTGGYTIVKDYVRLRKLSQREMFVPLKYPPGAKGGVKI
jgi:transposase